MKGGVSLEALSNVVHARTPRYSPSVHMIKLTENRGILPYSWVQP
jgi:hypothetical protein